LCRRSVRHVEQWHNSLCGSWLARPVLIFWLAALRPYFRPGVNLTFGDVPPFMWVPAALLLPAVILGWIGLRQFPG